MKKKLVERKKNRSYRSNFTLVWITRWAEVLLRFDRLDDFSAIYNFFLFSLLSLFTFNIFFLFHAVFFSDFELKTQEEEKQMKKKIIELSLGQSLLPVDFSLFSFLLHWYFQTDWILLLGFKFFPQISIVKRKKRLFFPIFT